MQDTDTKITVSSINDINSFNLERIITVKGSIENMSRGEAQISSKLRQSYENDLQALAPQSIMFPGLHPMAMMSTSSGNGMGFPGGRTGGGGAGVYPASNYPPMYQPTGGQLPGAADVQETTYLYIPNNAVGAIIGTKGSHIRNIIRFSGANVKIAPLEADKPTEQQTERKVTIVGTPEAQWKAQYLIYEKMREEGFVSGTDDVRLTVEILVPSSQVRTHEYSHFHGSSVILNCRVLFSQDMSLIQFCSFRFRLAVSLEKEVRTSVNFNASLVVL